MLVATSGLYVKEMAIKKFRNCVLRHAFQVSMQVRLSTTILFLTLNVSIHPSTIQTLGLELNQKEKWILVHVPKRIATDANCYQMEYNV